MTWYLKGPMHPQARHIDSVGLTEYVCSLKSWQHYILLGYQHRVWRWHGIYRAKASTGGVKTKYEYLNRTLSGGWSVPSIYEAKASTSTSETRCRSFILYESCMIATCNLGRTISSWTVSTLSEEDMAFIWPRHPQAKYKFFILYGSCKI